MVTRTFLQLHGLSRLDAFKKLRALAVKEPKVCIMDSVLITDPDIWNVANAFQTIDEAGSRSQVGIPNRFIQDHFSEVEKISVERCNTLISKSGNMLGDYDFFFEWFKDPTPQEVEDLIGKIDEVLKLIGVTYTLVTKKN